MMLKVLLEVLRNYIGANRKAMRWGRKSFQRLSSLQSPSCASNRSQIIQDAVKRLGGIKYVDANPEDLLYELDNYQGLDLVDVERFLQVLQKGTSLKIQDDQDACISEEDPWKTRASKAMGSRDQVREEFRATLLHLALSSDKIDAQLKAEEEMWCFCMQFPEDYEFDKDTLIQLWVARNFLQDDEHRDHIGGFYFDILLSNGYIMYTGTCFPAKVHTYLMNFECEDDLFETRRELYLRLKKLFYDDDIVEKNPTGLEDLKALMLPKSYASRISKVPNGVFSALKHVEVLDLSRTRITELHSSIGSLVELQYLDLSHTLIELLPETIGCLGKLKTLKLNECDRLLRLPVGMRKLTSLEHLELDVLRQLTFMPKGMGALTKLETLSAFLVDRVYGRDIKQLHGLNNLKGRFCIARLENVTNPNEAKEVGLCNKQHLKELELRWSDSCQPSNNERSFEDELILEALRPNSNLERLHISCYNGSKFPSWVSDSSSMLTSITLFKCENPKLLPALGRLPYLKTLSLIEINSVEEIADEFRGASDDFVAFPKLERLKIIGFALLTTWMEAKEGDYPHLCKLTVERCPKLIALPTSLLCRSKTLEHLEVIKCPMVNSLPEEVLSTSLHTLIIENSPGVVKMLQKRRERKKIQHVQNIWIDQQKVVKVM